MFEKILAFVFFLSVVIRESFGVEFDGLILVSGTTLAFGYLIANWWFDKPTETNARTIFMNILYGIAASTLTLAILFQELFLSGSSQMSIFGFVIFLTAIGLDFVFARDKQKVLTNRIKWRFMTLVGLVAILAAISQDDRIAFTFRRHPSFVVHWKDEKGALSFQEYREKYFELLK